ncbi:MAG: efflux RND transporter permease subunit, partial [bacterium]
MPSQETENVERKAGRERNAGRRLAEYSIRYPVTISMIFVSFLVLGAISIWKIPLVMLPDIDFPFVMVHVPYPNTTPAQIQETITRPLEEALSTLPNVQRLTSRSSQNSAFITLNFGWGQDMALIRSQVREKIEQVRNELPEDVEHIYVRNRGTDDFPILFGRIASGRDLRESYDFLNLKIIRPLEQIPGVAEVEIHGAARQEIAIYLRLDDVKRYRVDVGRLFRRLQAANLDVSLGHVTDGGVRYGVLARGAMGSIEEFRKFPVNERGILLADVADIDFRNPIINSGRHLNGEYAMSLEIRKASEANTVATVRRVMEKIEEFH